MRRFGMMIGFTALLGLATAALARPDDKCVCADIKKAGIGWCGHCHSGLAYGQTIKSEKVYNEVAGDKAPAAKAMKCKGCAIAAAKDGTCDHCHVSFAHGKMYHSMPAHDMAVGAKPDAKDMKCADCKKLAASGKDGYCSKCEGGLVAGLCFKGKTAYEKAEKAIALLKDALTSKCEGCAIGMLTDGTCDHCKVAFKDGKAVKS